MTVAPRRDDNPRRRLNAIDRTIGRIEQQLARRQLAELQSPLQIRLCRTTGGGDPYPDEGNTVRVVFLDAEFEPETGSQSFVSEDRDSPYSTVARTIDGSLPEEDAVLPAVYIPPIDANKGYWWLVTAAQRKSIVFELDDALEAEDETVSGTVVEQYGPGAQTSEETVTLRNLIGFFGDAGFKGLATWDKENTYVIIQLAQDCTPPEEEE